MRAQPALLALLCLSVPASIAAQQATSNSTPIRDSQAVAILTEVVNSAGGPAVLGAIQDLSATGNITHNWAGKEVEGTVHIWGMGTGNFRIDSAMPTGIESWVVGNFSGALKNIDGKLTEIPPYNILNAGWLTIPVLQGLAALNDPAATIQYVGQTQLGGRIVYEVEITPSSVGNFSADPNLSGLGVLTLYVDSSTFQILQETQFLRDAKNLKQTYLDVMSYSNYRDTNGIWSPFAITETFGGQQLWSISLNSISFNVGLTDAQFTLE